LLLFPLPGAGHLEVNAAVRFGDGVGITHAPGVDAVGRYAFAGPIYISSRFRRGAARASASDYRLWCRYGRYGRSQNDY
jgi:hypothetical protein